MNSFEVKIICRVNADSRTDAKTRVINALIAKDIRDYEVLLVSEIVSTRSR